MSDNSEVAPGLVDELLALPTVGGRAARLREAGLLDADGLDRLLDAADRLLGSDPGKARRLAELCAVLSGAASAPAAVPRASYIRAGAHNINGEFEEDLRLTGAAHDGYVALGMNLEALRTNVGKMAALLELGRYGEALDAGRAVLDALDGKGELVVAPTPQEADLLVALVHQNLGGCFEYMGRYDEALDAYAIAEDLYRDLGMTERLGEILGNRGAILFHLGRSEEALKAYETVAAASEEDGLVLSHAKALSNIGEVYLRLGNYARSLDALKRSRRLLDTLDALTEDFYVLRNTADAYLALNLYSEALTAYREADSSLRAAGMAHDQAQTLWGMGSALIARSEFEEAEGTSIPLNYGLSRADAADISQLTFTILIQSLDSLDDDSRLGAWLSTVARRHTWRLMERRRREGTGKGEDLAESATLVAEPDGAGSLKRWEQIEWLDHGLGLLDERCRELLISLYLDPQGLSYAEVAERLNMPLGSIGPTRARCLERMKRALLGE